MSTSAAIPDSQSIFGLTSDPPRVTKGDPTASNPQSGKAEEALDANGLTKHDRDNLMTVRRVYLERWSMPRRILVRNILRKMEYLKGNQYYVVGPDGFTFIDPFASTDAANIGTQQNENGNDYYRYVTNIIQWFERILVATLSASIPATRFQPTNAQSDLGNRVAQNASRANAYIERLNDEKGLLEQKISYLALCGAYFVYTRPLRDSQLSGESTEAKTVEQMETRQVKPNRYLCRNCGGETPLDQMAVESRLNCKFCNQPVSEADFYPAVNLPVPVVKQASQVPQVQVRKSLYNGLHIAVAHNADSDTGDPLTRTPFLDLSLEIDLGALRAMYPDMWRELAGGGDASGSGDNEVDRQSRMQQFTQNNGAAWWTRSSGILTQGQMPTYSRTWLQPEAFNILDLKEDADSLKAKFPKGCCVASWGGQFLDIRAAVLANEWTWGGTRRGFGAYPPAILDAAMDFQDKINDGSNTESEYYDRMAVPGIAYDSKAVTGKGLAGKYWAIGSWFPVAVKPKEGRKLQDVLFQPMFHMDAGLKEYLQRLVFLAQMVVGVTPQTYGGGQQHIDTLGGQEQALKVAMGILTLYWSQIRSESARTAKNAIKCLAENATEEVFDVIKGDDNRFRNEPIDIDSLKNEIDAYPEEEQGFPESRQEMAERFQDLITSAAKNPLIMEMLQPMKNRRMAVRTLLPQDMEIPGEKERIKILEDISRLMQGQPRPALDPDTGQQVMKPSVEPDPKLPNILALTEEVVSEYVTDNYWELREQTPQQYANIMAYLELASFYQRKNQLMNAPPAPPPGLSGAQTATLAQASALKPSMAA
jgi:hypothetical protein